jgi:hypothetical protein
MTIRPWPALIVACLAAGLSVSPAQTEKADSVTRKPVSQVKPRQPPKPTHPPSANFTGKIFAITIGGDLKPARLAQVYVLSGDAASKFEARISSSAADVKSQLDAMEVSKDLYERLKRVQCINRIVANRDNVLDLRDRYPNSVVSSQADEEGNFKINGVTPATLLKIIAFGRAGTNVGMWIEFRILEAGKDEAVKLSSPSLACQDPDGLANFLMN